MPPRSRLPGKQLSWLEHWLGLETVALIRGERRLEPEPDTVLESGDRLVLIGRRRDILRIRHLRGLVLRHDLELGAARHPSIQVRSESLTPRSLRGVKPHPGETGCCWPGRASACGSSRASPPS